MAKATIPATTLTTFLDVRFRCVPQGSEMFSGVSGVVVMLAELYRFVVLI
jgi:hypothetical protein